jgi:hypothetical protein
MEMPNAKIVTKKTPRIRKTMVTEEFHPRQRLRNMTKAKSVRNSVKRFRECFVDFFASITMQPPALEIGPMLRHLIIDIPKHRGKNIFALSHSVCGSRLRRLGRIDRG